MIEKKFRFRYTNGKDWIFKVFTMTQCLNGAPFKVMSDMPMYKDYRIEGDDDFTGLKDKNGKEIYEGDIVKVNTFEDGNIRRLVIYDAPGFWLAKDNIDKISVFAFSTPNIHETIIGNIYENPELLAT